MTSRENNIRHISQFLRDIQQITEYSTNRNTFNVNINYYENYYNGYENEREESLINERSRIDSDRVSSEVPTNSYFIEINRDRNAPENNNPASNVQENTTINNNTETSQNNQNTENIQTTTPLNNRENVITRQITIPLRTSISEIGNTYPVNLTNSLSDINNIINRTLSDSFSNLSLDSFNIDIDRSQNRNNGLSLSDLNTKTTLIVYSSLPDNTNELKCHICNEDYNETDICRKNNLCGHYFHQTCLDNWYATHNTCPICNRIV